MASEDVIELGSSDDDVEPAPKKPRTKPNAMVHIPNNLSGVTIKPAKACNNALPPSLLGRPITITKVPKNALINPVLTKLKNNGCAIQKYSGPSRINPKPIVKQPQKVRMTGPRPPHSVSVINNAIKVYPVQQQYNRVPVRHAFNSQKSKCVIPPTITVTKTYSRKQTPINTNMTNVKRKIVSKVTFGEIGGAEVSTVELDDDDSSSQAPGPARQWYLRPEEPTQFDKNTIEEASEMEKQNNSEPTSSEMVEITIQDSPIQCRKKAFEVGAEFAITIDDSPIKVPSDKKLQEGSSDSENDQQRTESHSKKKLEYPKDQRKRQSIEIELLPLGIQSKEKSIADEEDTVDKQITNKEPQNNDVIEIEESPMKIQEIEATTPKKTISKLAAPKNKPFNIEKYEKKEDGEFHSVYQEFIDLCFKLESTEDMEKIIEKKIKAYYRQVPKTYTESAEFIEMVSSKIISMKASPEKMYLYIKDIVDELNFKRKMMKSQTTNIEETKSNELESFLNGENSEYGPKRQRQIRKLEKTLKKLHRAIQKLEEQEVDFDDDDDSVYLLTERYKERMVRVHAKFCQLTNTKMPSEPRLQIEPRLGQPKGPAKKLEKWINKKVPIGTPLPFPDFHDVLRCVREANVEDKLGWNEVDIMEEARDLFTRCGKKLQRRRQENEWRLAASRLPVDLDPAENSSDLKVKLEKNKALANKKETEVFNKYADKQNQLKLEAVEIGDKEAEESPEESDEEQEDTSNVETPLKTKEKRKERLKRLLNCKSKRSIDTGKEPDDTEQKTSATKSNDDASEQPEKTEKNDDEDKKDSDKNSSNQTVYELTDFDSDVDELHLLQKLHSDEFNSSSSDTSNLESAIEFSDTQDSSNDNNLDGDVISIEDSSYSESESRKETLVQSGGVFNESSVCELTAEDSNEEIEFSSAGVAMDKKHSNNVQASEEVFLASSEDDNCSSKDESPETCINLNDDSISIGETVVAGIDNVSEIEATENLNGISVGLSTNTDLSTNTNTADSEKKDCDQIQPMDIDSNVSLNGNETDMSRTENKKNKGNLNMVGESENPVGSSTDENEVVTTSLPDSID